MNDALKKTVGTRLNRIEGQVRGVSRMVDESRYCIEILTQLQAIRAAVQKVEEEVLRDHLQHCVAHAFESGDITDQKDKVEELVSVLGRLRR